MGTKKSNQKKKRNQSDGNGRTASLMLMINKTAKPSAKDTGPSVNHLQILKIASLELKQYN